MKLSDRFWKEALALAVDESSDEPAGLASHDMNLVAEQKDLLGRGCDQVVGVFTLEHERGDVLILNAFGSFTPKKRREFEWVEAAFVEAAFVGTGGVLAKLESMLGYWQIRQDFRAAISLGLAQMGGSGYRVRCQSGHVTEVPKGHPLVPDCRERAENGLMDALAIPRDGCPGCIGERLRQTAVETDMVVDGFWGNREEERRSKCRKLDEEIKSLNERLAAWGPRP